MILFYKVTAFLSHILPHRIAIFITERLADGAYFISHRRARQIVIRNLSQAFPERGERELATIALRVFRNFARFIYEFLLLPRIDSRNMHTWLTPIHAERVDYGLKKNRGVIVLTGHLGNWELGAAFLALRGHPLTVIALDHPSRAVTDFFNTRRLVHNMKVASLRVAVRESLKALKGNGVVAILGDRDYTGKGELISFFGKETRVPSGILSIAANTGSLVVPAFAVREGDKYAIHFSPPLDLQRTRERQKDLRVNLKRWMNVLESYVRRYPEQWFVFAPVWRTDEGRHSHRSLQ